MLEGYILQSELIRELKAEGFKLSNEKLWRLRYGRRRVQKQMQVKGGKTFVYDIPPHSDLKAGVDWIEFRGRIYWSPAGQVQIRAILRAK